MNIIIIIEPIRFVFLYLARKKNKFDILFVTSKYEKKE